VRAGADGGAQADPPPPGTRVVDTLEAAVALVLAHGDVD